MTDAETRQELDAITDALFALLRSCPVVGWSDVVACLGLDTRGAALSVRLVEL
jgi:hypothetical protein